MPPVYLLLLRANLSSDCFVPGTILDDLRW